MTGQQVQSLGEFISSLRKLIGKTQEELAEDSGLSVRSISDLERDTIARPRRRSIELVSAALKLDPADTRSLVVVACRLPGPRRDLMEKLGIEPRTELSELYQRILTTHTDFAAFRSEGNGTAVPVVTPHQLPTATRDFVGRADDIATLDEMLDDAGRETCGMAVISGMPAVGKTALAIHWAHRVAHQFGGGQLHADLRGFAPSGVPMTASEAIRGFLDALGVPAHRIPADLAARAALYRSILAGRRVLIMLDNASDEHQIRPLLPGMPGCLVIVTSRSPLVGLAAAEGASIRTLDIFSDTEAYQMLATRLDSRAAAEQDAVDKIARMCAGLPMALSIAAARAAAFPTLRLADLATFLGDERTRLDTLDTGDPATSVRAVFSWSVRRLSPEAARMFRTLGPHPAPDFTARTAADLAGIMPTAATRVLRELTRASLLTERLPGRYSFHDLLRAYAAEQADTD